MITSASFRNFKALKNVDINFERFTVIVGPNASGKTSILQGLHYLSRLRTVEPRQWFRGPLDPQLLFSKGEAKEEIRLECKSNAASMRLTMKTSDSIWKFAHEGKFANGSTADWTPLSRGNTLFNQVGDEFRSADYLNLDSSHLGEATYSQLSRPLIEANGSGLATVLAFMALSQPDVFQLIQDRLRSVIPSLERIRFDRVPITRFETETITINDEKLARQVKKEYIGDSVVFDFKGAPNIPAHLVSEGTMLVLGLVTVLHGPDRPRLILLDDLEHGLHPKAQKEVVTLIKKVLDEVPDLQVIATTHSPYLLDNVRPEEVQLTTLREDGSVACAALVDHPSFEKWKEEMSPGEMWSMFGEQWAANLKSPQ